MNEKQTITLDGAQIAQLQGFADNEMDAQISIGWFPERKPDADGNEMPEGYYAWFTEYPDDGALLLEPNAGNKPSREAGSA